jgi:hypothetical protein
MHIIGIILAILLLLATIQSTLFFLIVMKVKFVEWIVFNACAPSNITFLVGFALFLFFKDRTILHMAILPMFFFGVLGLFVFPWNGVNIIPQIGHMLMALNIGWTVFVTLNTHDYKAATVGMLLGIAVFSVFIGFQQQYVATHPEDFKKILQLEKPK